ncbi:unnamed protein product [Lactuca virosa]|uniref:Uncharacterized protein n=1 Tax=Lactuca virosa TaxID=75947 RepID=A0AAU9LYV7_9ASTR|nr:unnamed protein product [Lactuca virosa]CAH1420790.1 unnamed protein product [Lactuca virosa]
MFCDVPASSKILEGYRALKPSGFRPLNAEFQEILAEVDKGKKGGRGSKKTGKKDTSKEGPSKAAKLQPKKRKAPAASTVAPKRPKQPVKRRKSPTPSPSQSEDESSDSEFEVRVEDNQQVGNEEEEHVHTEEEDQVRSDPPFHTKDPSPNREVTLPLNDYVPSHPPSPKTTTSIPITIAPCPPPVSSQPTTVTVTTPIFTDSTIPPKTSAVRSFITNVTGLLSDIIETRDPVISLNVKKHLSEKLSSVFAMLHRLEGVSKPVSFSKQGGDGGSNAQMNEPPKAPAKPFIGNDDEDEEPDEAELKRRKAREAEIK